MSQLNEHEMGLLAEMGIQSAKALKIGEPEVSVVPEDKETAALQALTDAFTSLQEVLNAHGIDHQHSEKYAPVLKRWLIMSLCGQKLSQIVEQSRKIDRHFHSKDSELKDDRVFMSEAVAGDALEKMAIPAWKDQLLGNTYLFSWSEAGFHNFSLAGRGEESNCTFDGLGRSYEEVVKRLFNKDSHTLSLGRLFITRVSFSEVGAGGQPGQVVGVTLSDDQVTAEFQPEYGWTEMLKGVIEEVKLEFKSVKLTQNAEGQKIVTIEIPKMQELVSDKLVLREGETAVLAPMNSDVSGFYGADVLYQEGKVTFKIRAKRDRYVEHTLTIPDVNAASINEEILRLFLRAETKLAERLQAMNGLYVKPESFTKTELT